MQEPIIFQLPDVTPVHCTQVQVRTEEHGEEHVRAVDMFFHIEGTNDLLDKFDPQIRNTLYCNLAAEAGQGDMPETLPPELRLLPDLRLPGLVQVQQWLKGEKLKGYRFVLDYGMGTDKSNVDLAGCVLSRRWFESKPNSVAKIGFCVSYAGPEMDDIVTRGKLTGLKDGVAHIQLIAGPTLQPVVVKPGRPKKQKDDPDQLPLGAGGGDDPEVETEDDDATSAFVEAHGGGADDSKAG